MFVRLPEAPVQRDLLVEKNIVQASLWAVLCHYGNVRRLNTPTNKFAQVGMIELPGDEEGGLKQEREAHIRWGVCRCVLPDLFDFLSDGFGQRESLCVNPLDGHGPAITGEESCCYYRVIFQKICWLANSPSWRRSVH